MILLNDVFRFDELIKREHGKRIKLRFNTSWKESKIIYDFIDMYVTKSNDFVPYILSVGSGKKTRNDSRDIQFQFIEVEPHKWLFIGAYKIISPSNKNHVNANGAAFNYAEAVKLTEYDMFIDRVIVDWINKPQSFYYIDSKIIYNIGINEICSKPYFEQDSEFPGYENLAMSYQDLKIHWTNKSWREQLSSIYGVYLITDLKNGKLYVGSAYGADGVYGRWSIYLKEGYDKNELEDNKYPNIKLKNLVSQKGIEYIQSHFQYTLLEIFRKTETGKQKALDREKYWKSVYKSIEFGYNSN